jgi:phosphomevalonate kinase
MTNHHFSSMTAVSAPGKVLLTGGYLVLDRNYTGTIFALGARIHVIVEQLRRGSRQLSAPPLEVAKDGAEQQTCNDTFVEATREETILVRSPQFQDAIWEYGLEKCDDSGGVKVVQRGDGYVLFALRFSLI